MLFLSVCDVVCTCGLKENMSQSAAIHRTISRDTEHGDTSYFLRLTGWKVQARCLIGRSIPAFGPKFQLRQLRRQQGH